MKKISLALIATLVVSTPLITQAQSELDDRFYVAPFASYTFPEGSRNADPGPGGGFAIGRPINRAMNLELRGTYEYLDNDGGFGDWENWTAGVDALFFFSRQGFQPFFLLGVGGIRDDVDNDDSAWSVTANTGLGFLYPITDRVLLRTDVRYRWDDNNDNLAGESGDFGDGILNVGVQIPLGEKPRPPAPPPAAPPPVRRFELSADTLFAFNRATLMPRGEAELDNLVQQLRNASYRSITVVGYTDPIGSDSYNLDLSQRRANTVVSYLVSKGVPASAIRAEGRGETNLKVTPADCSGVGSRAALIDCYQPNRRVEVTVTGETRQ